MSRMPFSLLLCGATVSFFATNVAAQQDPAVQLRQDQLREQRQTNMRPAERFLSFSSEPALTASPSEVPEPVTWLTAPTIKLVGNSLIPQAELDGLLLAYRSLPLGERRINLLKRQLEAQLVRQGLVTSHVRIRVDRNANRLELEFLEGTIGAITQNGKLPETGVSNAFAGHPGQRLVLSDLEQGIHQIQRLRMYQAEMRILPGQSPGASSLDLTLTEGRPWWAQLGLDNQGAKSTGTTRQRATLTIEDTFGMLDSISTTYISSHYSDALLISGSVPDGYNTWSASYAVSRYRLTLPAGFHQQGGSTTTSLAWNRVLYLAADGRDSSDLSLYHSDAWRTISDVALTPGKLTVVRGSLARVRQGQGWQAWVEGGIAVGLPWFDATRDTQLKRADPHARFEKIEGHAGISVALGGTAWQYSGQLDTQYSRVGLYGQEQLNLGGKSTVRGYDEGIVAADLGYIARHELIMPAQPVGPLDAKVEPFAFIDHSRASSIDAASVRLASIGIGMRLHHRHGDAEVAFAKPLDYSSFLVPDPWHFHFTLRIDL